ncbi:GUN4 domain-containing protein [Nostoc sp.]|uniref:GUN4 domain-containing protein n=1 Tax=Nostoc sp. TaxID=1180 RepID=UPI002FF587DE
MTIKRIEKLENLLRSKNWEAANRETQAILVDVFNEVDINNRRFENYDYEFISDDFSNFSCEYLNKIDKLWITYTQGKYGFSIQKDIYLNVGGRLNYSSNPNSDDSDLEANKKFLSNIGWVLPNGDTTNIRFDNYDNYPKGYFPYWYGTLLKFGGFRGLFCRIETCEKF